MRIPSSSIFTANGDGTYTTSKTIKIGGVTLSNITFSKGVKIGSTDLTYFVGRDLEVENQNGVYVITGYYE